MSIDEDEGPILVDHAALAPDTLRRLVEEFVTRDGTDYGDVETPLDRRVAAVLSQLQSGVAVIAFDPRSETATIVLKRDLRP
jgi:uncharacterized protein YheU (UPF0270 family)